jgi:PKD repeat protein
VNFNGATSKPGPGRTIVAYDWSFGDGFNGGGPQVSHAYSKAGTYLVVLTVTDDAGRVGFSVPTTVVVQ